MITRPLLAATVDDINQLTFPLLATPKIDGIRCLVIDGIARSRTFKLIPNRFIRAYLMKSRLDNLDGELIVGKNFQDTASGVMTENSEPDFVYKVFDCFDNPDDGYEKRLMNLRHKMQEWYPRHDFIFPALISSLTSLEYFSSACAAEGYEGVMLRKPNSPYKCGRSTLREGYLMKLKPFSDSEALVLALLPREHNANRQESDNFGLAKRSHSQEGMVTEDTLGSLMVKDLITGVEFSVGSGFDDRSRKRIWDNPEDYIGKVITYKYQKHGMKDKPRCPVFKCFRQDI